MDKGLESPHSIIFIVKWYGVNEFIANTLFLFRTKNDEMDQVYVITYHTGCVAIEQLR